MVLDQDARGLLVQRYLKSMATGAALWKSHVEVTVHGVTLMLAVRHFQVGKLVWFAGWRTDQWIQTFGRYVASS
jgi:hypothetical protein